MDSNTPDHDVNEKVDVAKGSFYQPAILPAAAGPMEVIEMSTLPGPFRPQTKSLDDKALAEAIKRKIIGQDHVVDGFVRQIKRRMAQADLRRGNVEKPLGVFLLGGPPGTGKTYFSKVLAANMYEGKGKLLEIEMSQFREAHSAWSLIGSPPGYVGSEGSLTKKLLENPKAIVLLDGFEKAHPEVLKIFLTAWNDGYITDIRTQKKVSTTKAIFLLTTNVAFERLVEIERAANDDPFVHETQVIDALKGQQCIAPEVLSRIDKTFVFLPFDDRSVAQLAAVEIRNVARMYEITINKIDIKYIMQFVATDSSRWGNVRDLARQIEQQLGDAMLEAKQKGMQGVQIVLVDDKPVLKAADPNA